MGIIIPTECGYFEGQMENRKPVKVFLEAADCYSHNELLY